jgi:ABC-type nitrate/sulfonate/bicarbonate transport system substrate-binding protein
MHRCWLLRILVLIVFHQQLASILPVSAQERRVRVAVTSPRMTNLSLYIANRRGFFKEHQIFNEIIGMRSAARQIQALIAGSIELSAQAPDPLIRAVERGTDLTMLSGLANSAAYDLVADKKFRSIEELRDTTLGVSGINSSSTLLLQKMLAAHGLSYPRDYTLVESAARAIAWRPSRPEQRRPEFSIRRSVMWQPSKALRFWAS